MVHCFKLQKDKPDDAFITLQLATAHIISDALFGTNGFYDDEGLRGLLQLTDSYSEAVNGSSHIDFLPLLEYLPDEALSKLKFLLKAFNDATTTTTFFFKTCKETSTEGHVRNIAYSFISVEEEETMKILDFIVPIDTMVFVNLWSVRRAIQQTEMIQMFSTP